MSHERRLERLEAAIGAAEPLVIRVVHLPADRWNKYPPLTAEEVETYTTEIITVPAEKVAAWRAAHPRADGLS